MYQIVLFVHFVAIALAFFATGIVFSSVNALRRCQNAGQARAAMTQTLAAAKLHPLATVLLLLTGGYMTQAAWNWSTPWILCGVIGLLAVAIFGGGVLGARERRLHTLLADAPEGAMSADLRGRLRDPLLTVGGTAIPFVVFAIMFVMVLKTNLLASLTTLLAGAILGIGVGLATQPSAAASAEAAAET